MKTDTVFSAATAEYSGESSKYDAMRDWAARVAALLAGGVIFLVGVHFAFFQPALVPGVEPTAMPGVLVANSDGMTNVRVGFGGFHMGVGLVGLLGALNRAWTRGALACLVVMGLTIVGTRMFGLHIDGVGEASKMIFPRELGFFLVSLIGLVLSRPANTV